MKEIGYITYSEYEKKIVETGIEAIKRVLEYGTSKEKERLLFCLDRYLDPWFEYTLAYRKEINSLLEEVILASNSLVVKESALQLLTDYGIGSFNKLSERLEEIEPEIRAEVNYLLETP